jgi:hypothetical protein
LLVVAGQIYRWRNALRTAAAGFAEVVVAQETGDRSRADVPVAPHVSRAALDPLKPIDGFSSILPTQVTGTRPAISRLSIRPSANCISL